MKTKTCSKCNDPKPIKEFRKRSGRAGRVSWCKTCKNEYDRIKYHTDPEHREAHRLCRNEIINRNVLHVREYLKSHPCVDCGEEDIAVLEFDHVRGKKLSDVSRLVRQGASIDVINREIEKCDVRCANDHKRRTDERRYSSVVQRQNV